MLRNNRLVRALLFAATSICLTGVTETAQAQNAFYHWRESVRGNVARTGYISNQEVVKLSSLGEQRASTISRVFSRSPAATQAQADGTTIRWYRTGSKAYVNSWQGQPGRSAYQSQRASVMVGLKYARNGRFLRLGISR